VIAQDSKSPEAGNAYNKGLDLARKGDFKSAVPLLKKRFRLMPNLHRLIICLVFRRED
jgi:hypothetical protein